MKAVRGNRLNSRRFGLLPLLLVLALKSAGQQFSWPEAHPLAAFLQQKQPVECAAFRAGQLDAVLKNRLKTPKSSSPIFGSRPEAVRYAHPTRLPWSVECLPLFCRIEHKWAKKHTVPLKFRLGSVEYVDWLEGKL